MICGQYFDYLHDKKMWNIKFDLDVVESRWSSFMILAYLAGLIGVITRSHKRPAWNPWVKLASFFDSAFWWPTFSSYLFPLPLRLKLSFLSVSLLFSYISLVHFDFFLWCSKLAVSLLLQRFIKDSYSYIYTDTIHRLSR